MAATKQSYSDVVSSMHAHLNQEREHTDILHTRYTQAFVETVGCTPQVMQQLDQLYDAADADHAARLAVLDKSFGKLRAQRVQFLEGLLQQLNDSDTKATSLDHAIVKLQDVPISPDVKTGLQAEQQAVQADKQDVLQLLKEWYGTPCTDANHLPIPTTRLSTTQLPAELKERLQELVKPASEPAAGSIVLQQHTVTAYTGPSEADACTWAACSDELSMLHFPAALSTSTSFATPQPILTPADLLPKRISI